MRDDTTMPLLSVQDLRVQFPLEEGLVKAVDGVSFDLAAGKTLAIVGESGCGKSMTARAILRLIERPGRIASGRILWRPPRAGGAAEPIDLVGLPPRGREIRAIRGRDIALVFQEPMTSFSPVHTVGNQIVEAIRLHRRVSAGAARKQAIEMLDRVGVPAPAERIDDYPHQLSGGLRQRAMIAMALACDPALLIADEPTTALDVTTQAQILELLARLQRQAGMAMILITHNLGIVAQLADEVAVMYLGKLVERACVDSIFHRARHPYTRALLQSTPRLRGGARQKLAPIRGAIPGPFSRPAGCTFHPRCPQCMSGRCDAIEPPRTTFPDGGAPGRRHEVYCYLYPEGDVP